VELEETILALVVVAEVQGVIEVLDMAQVLYKDQHYF
tara:strand:+ start:70 stop:180 length:111 start_codon:yes stop_codon:yes gene_type:complete